MDGFALFRRLTASVLGIRRTSDRDSVKESLDYQPT